MVEPGVFWELAILGNNEGRSQLNFSWVYRAKHKVGADRAIRLAWDTTPVCQIRPTYDSRTGRLSRPGVSARDMRGSSLYIATPQGDRVDDMCWILGGDTHA